MELAVLEKVEMGIEAGELVAELCPHDADPSATRALGRLVDEALALGRPRAAYRPASSERGPEDGVVVDGVTLRSRILAVHLDDVHRVFPFVATCGRELAAWAAAKRDLLERFWAEAIMGRALAAATQALERDLERRYGLLKAGMLTPGSLADWRMEEQAPLFRILGDVEALIGVRLTEGLMMEPVHSLSGIVFPTSIDFQQCRLCPRERCPERRAPFEEGVYDTRYGGASTAPAE